MTYPSGAVVSYLRDSTGRITGVTAKPTASGAAVTVVSDVDYLPFGPATLMTFGNGRTLDKTYDANYGIEAIADSAVDGVALDFTLDAVGNVTGLDERLAGGGTTTRTVDYDDLDRLEALKDGATTVQGFTYDATGNRTSETAGSPEAYAYPTTSHRLTQTGATARGYDAAGNTTAIGSSRVFTYDDRGRMSRLTDGGVLTRQYVYNGRGERVAKRNPTVPAGDVLYVYDETGRLLGEYEIGGARIKEYVWLDDTLVAVLGSHGGSSHQYVLTDHLGTPRAVVHPGTNAILWRWDLTGSVFGEHAALNDPDGDGTLYSLNLRYPGQYYDAETLLHYNYFRDYDPTTGRYVQSDPIGLAGGVSTHGYVRSNPAGATDPLGLFSTTELCKNPKNAEACAAAMMTDGGAGVAATAAVVAPRLTGRMESLRDRYCKDDDNECTQLKQALRKFIQDARGKLLRMHGDKALYEHARFRPNFPMTGNNTTWKGHGDDLRGVIGKIRDMIELGRLLGCNMDEEERLSVSLFVPEKPGP